MPYITPKIAASYNEVHVNLPLTPVVFIFQVRSCCERCARALSPYILFLRHGPACNTNFSELYGKYLQASLQVLTAVLLKFQVFWDVTPYRLTDVTDIS